MSLQSFAQTLPEDLNRRTIPYDYRFEFKINPGEKDKVLRNVVTVSVEAEFTAVSVGYGFIPDVTVKSFGFDSTTGNGVEANGNRFRQYISKLSLGNVLDQLASAMDESNESDNRIGVRTARALASGIRFNQRVLNLLLNGVAPSANDLKELFEVAEVLPEQVRFLYALFDEASGRAFQNEPILNIAGWGIADGDRPFRQFAPPIRFAPRSTIRLELIPKSEFSGQLQVVLHGYKVLGGAGTPTSASRTRRHFAR